MKEFFETRLKIFTSAESIFRGPKKQKQKKKNIGLSGGKVAHLATLNGLQKNLRFASHKLKVTKEIWRSIVFLLCSIFCFLVSLQSVKLYTSNSSSCMSLRIKIFLKMPNCWSLVFLFVNHKPVLFASHIHSLN